jgi:uncharacterized protein
MKAWKRLAGGRYVDLNNLTEADIDIDDINVALNYIHRFNGHHKDNTPLTVAQHTLLCVNIGSLIFPDDNEIRIATIIHDFGEAYYGDISTPIKHAFGEAFKSFAKPIDDAVDRKFWGIGGPNQTIKDCVKVCDLISLDIERRAMWKSQHGKDKWPTTPDIKLSLLDKQAMFDEVAQIKFVDLKGLLNV